MSHWTPERRARQAALIRQWRPWETATGPRTVKGKTISSRNAYQGGVRPILRELSKLLRAQREGIERITANSDCLQAASRDRIYTEKRPVPVLVDS
jgi:hypothetical protein